MVDEKEHCVMTDQYNRIQGAVIKSQHRNYSVYKGVNTIGRNKSAIINLKNLNVSQNHAVIIIVDDTQHFISDLNSSNGTYLTGTKLSPYKLYELVNDVEIKFGDVSVSYSKVSTADTTIHLQVESIDMTQNMTQNFYEAGTQLMINDSSLNHTRNAVDRFSLNNNDTHKITQVPTTSATVRVISVENSKSNSSENKIQQEVDIHEMPTQVVELPEELKKLEDQEVDIHELPTQVVDIPPQLKKPTEQHEMDIHEMPTQVVDLPQNFNSSGKLENMNLQEQELPTQVVNIHQEIELSQRSSNASTQIDEDIKKSDNLDQVKQKTNSEIETNDSFIENTSNFCNVDGSVIEETVIDETHLEKEIDEDSNNSIDFLTMQKPVASEYTQSVKEPNSSNTASEDMGIRIKRPPRKLSSTEELSESQNGNPVCNSDSDTDIENEKAIDFLAVQKLKKSIKESNNSNVSIYSASQDIGIRKKRPTRKLSSSEELSQVHNGKMLCNSDSDTDIEIEINISNKLNKPKLPPKITNNSGSDTEIDELPQRSKCGNKVLNSDSDTDIEEHVSYKEVLSQNIKPKILNKKRIFDSDSETDIEEDIEKNEKQNSDIFNDTDFIPPTQDAFTNMYKNSKTPTANTNSQNESSEESFKLGLTELMAESMETKRDDEKNITNNATNEEIISDAKLRDVVDQQLKNNEEDFPSENVHKEDPVLSRAVEDLQIEPKLTHADISKEHYNQQHTDSDMVNSNQSTSIISEIAKEVVTEEDFYMMPTQKLNNKETDIEQTEAQVNTEADDDFYLMPTQKPNQNNNQPEFKTPKKKYTFRKKVVTLDESLSTILGKNQDDLYSASTQKTIEQEDKTDNIYLQPTQKLNEEPNLHDLYLQPTQDLNLLKVTNTEDLFMAATQQIDIGTEKYNTAPDGIVTGSLLQENQQPPLTIEMECKEPENETDLYLAATQPMPRLEITENDKISSITSVTNLYLQETEDLDLMSNKKINEDTNLKTNNETCPVQKTTEKFDDAYFAMTQPINSNTQDKVQISPKKPITNLYLQETEDLGLIKNIDANNKKNNEQTSLKMNKENGPAQKTTEKIDDAYIAMTQPINSNILDKKVEIEKPITDLYLQETEYIGLKDLVNNKSDKNEDPYLTATQQINQDSGVIGPAKDNLTRTRSRTKRHLQPDINDSKKRKLIDTKIENSGYTDTSASKRPSNLEGETSKANTENKVIDTSETLSQIQRFVAETSQYSKKPQIKTLPKKRSCTKPQIENQSETMSQIEAFVKKPLSTIKENVDTPSKKQKVETPSKKQKTNTVSKKQKAEIPSKKPKTNTSSKKQIDKTSDEVEQSDEEFQKPERCTRSRRTTSTNLSKTHVSIEECEAFNRVESDASTSSDTSDAKTVKSDEEKSFALLEAKSTKTRKSQRVVNSAEVKVAVVKNRRSMATSAMPENLTVFTSPEKGKRKQKPKVVFTMLDSPLLESLIKQLGGSVVDSVDSSTVLVTEQVKRSQKLLTAVGQGKPICSPEWIRASKKANEFLDPWNYILIDEEAESKWKFSLRESLMRSNDKKLLSNYTFQVIVNNAEDVLKGAIKACGGKCVPRCPAKNVNEFFIVVASPENKNKYAKIRQQHPQVIIVEPEAIFDGVLRQELRLDKHILI